MKFKNTLFVFFLLFSYSLISRAQVSANFTTTGASSGCSPLLISFTDQSTGIITSRKWYFGNGNTSTLQNPGTSYTSAGTYTVSLVVSDGTVKDSIAKVALITVFANPIAGFSTLNTSECVPFAINFQDTTVIGSGAITNYSWTFGDGNSGNTANPSNNYTVTGSFNVILTVTDANGCTDNEVKTNYITINPLPIVGFSTNDPTGSCTPPLTVNFTNSSSGTGNLDYLWDFGNGNTSANQSPSSTFNNIGSYNVSLQVTDQNNCVNSLTKNQYIVIGSSTTADFIPSITNACPWQNITFNNNSTGATNYLWDFGDGTTSNDTTPVHAYASGGTYVVTLQSSINGTCISTATATIEIDNIIADFTSGPKTSCDVPLDVNYIDKSTNAVLWQWNFGNSNASNLQDPTNTFNSAGTYTDQLIVTSIAGCNDTMTIVDNISLLLMQPDMDFDLIKGCIPLTINFSDISVSPLPIVSWNWDFNDGNTSDQQNPSNTFTNAGVYPISLTLTNSDGCQAIIVDSIRAGTKPTADFSVVPDTACAFSPVIFTDLSTDANLVNEWIWEFGDGASSLEQHPIHLYSDTGNFPIHLMAAYNGCFDEITKDTVVYVLGPISTFQTDYFCEFPLQQTMVSNVIDAHRTYWDFGDGSPIDSVNIDPVHTFPASGDYIITLTSYNDTTKCLYIFSYQVKVREIESVFNINKNIACVYESVTFDGSASQDVNATYEWNFGDSTGNTQISTPIITHSFSQKGTYQVRLVVTDINSCKDTSYQTIRIFQPEIDFSADTLYGCTPLVVNFSDLSIGDTTIVQWFWNFGDGQTSTTQNPSNSYSVSGTKTITLTITDELGCNATLSKTDYIYPMMPVPNFSSNTQICKNWNVNFINLSQGDGLTFLWDFGDASTSTQVNPSHVYADSGRFTITLTATDTAGCTATEIYLNHIHAQDIPIANFIADLTVGECYPQTINFTDLSISPYINSWTWNFGDNQPLSTLKNPSHSYLFLGKYDVTLTVSTTYGCTNSITYPEYIEIKGPFTNFTMNPNTICRGVPVTFTITDDTNIGDFTWDFGDGNIQPNINPFVYTYDQTGPILIRLLYKDSTNICSQISENAVTVYDAVANFSSDISTGCPDLNVNFTNTSDAGTYAWTFGDGGSSTQTNPTHSFANIGTVDSVYTTRVILTTQFGCKDTAEIPIRVYPPGNANYTMSGTTGCTAYNVNFTSTSNSQASYSWNFNNGNTSTSSNPSQTFANASDTNQTYSVMLATQTANSCKDTIYKNVIVYPKPEFDLSNLPNSGCSPLIVSFGPIANSYSNNWNFGDGFSSPAASPTHTYTNNTGGNITRSVRYIGTSQYGCKDTTFADIVVLYKPDAQFNLSSSSVCTPVDVSVNNTSTHASLYHWDYGDGSSLDTTGLNHLHLFTNATPSPKIFNVVLISGTPFGCTDTTTKSITINPSVVADFQISPDTICSGEEVSFQNNSIGGGTNPNNYIWNLGNGLQFPSYPTPPALPLSVTGILDTTYTITLITTSSFNNTCKDTVVRKVFVNHLPKPNYTIPPNTGCTPQSILFSNSTLGANSYSWNFGDQIDSGNTSSNPSHTFINTNTTTSIFNITLTAFTQAGCKDSITKPLSVFPTVIASFSPPLSGCSKLIQTLQNTSTSGASLLWDITGGLPNNSTTSNPTITHINSGTTDINYIVKLTATLNGCSDDTSMSLTVYPVPQASFSTNPVIQKFPSATVNITNTSTSNPSWQYNWNFGDLQIANTQTPSSHIYGYEGNYIITLIINSANNCTDTAKQTITILPPRAVPLIIAAPDTGCSPLDVKFDASGTLYATSFEWDFGNGVKSTEQNPDYTYLNGGTYSATIKVMGRDGDIVTQSFPNIVTVYDRAKPLFTMSPETYLIPSDYPVTINNLSQFASSYIWDLGDGDSSYSKNPTHYYKDKGTYSIVLVANNIYNCPDSISLPIVAKLRGIMDFPNVFIPNQSGPSGGYYDLNNINNEIFFPKFQAITDYHLMIFNRWGELIFETFDIKQGWDGYYRGQLCQQDSYVWKVNVSFEDSSNEIITEAGSITLLR